ncbi:alpha/beta hydrolase [Saccharibacillus sp. CPCC 101409]|uniref:alpha/beta hydrolase n=1 Tax=Saccharibacillus sp. CPCC 101409 TaxID=3058041 RepID=UPI002673770E|nr:alpha/beta hydrolase [Saccharibacillus sp. CPCC 101409]MDO3410005.1 alpha/beta hydrolase [Saccharibacillus sp. CPCC 101409]
MEKQPETQADTGIGQTEQMEQTAPKERKPRRRKKSLIRRLLSGFGWGLIVVFALLLTGFVYQWFGEQSDRAAYTVPGQLVQVGGHRMHVYKEEKTDRAPAEPAVVLISGWGTANPYADFSPVYEGLRGQAEFAVVERFGYGYSDVTDEKRDIDEIAEELHEALAQADVRPPFVLAAHSLGSLEAIRYTQLYPDDVAGLLMIDTGSPEFYQTFRSGALRSDLNRIAIKSGIVRALYHVNGFAGYLSGQRNGLKLLTPEMREQDRLATLLVACNTNVTEEMRRMHANANKIVAQKKQLDAPMIVLAADWFGEATEERMDSLREFGSTWSTDAKLEVVQDSAHSIQAYQPQKIVEAALELTGSAR